MKLSYLAKTIKANFELAKEPKTSNEHRLCYELNAGLISLAIIEQKASSEQMCGYYIRFVAQFSKNISEIINEVLS